MLIKKCNLPKPNFQEGLEIIKQNVKLSTAFEVAIDCVNHFEADLSSWVNDLEKINKKYFDMQHEDRSIFGDFLSATQFGKLSFLKYKSLLKSNGLEHFNDSLVSYKIKDSEAQQVLFYIRFHWWNFSDASTKFCISLANEGVLKELAQDLVNLIGTEGNILGKSHCFESAIGALHNMAKVESLRQLYRDAKVVDTLGNFLNYEDQPKVTMLVLMTLALIIDENQTHLLISRDSVFDLIFELIQEAMKRSDHRYSGFSLEELLLALSGLSKNDEVKKIVVQKGILDQVQNVLLSCQGNEIIQALKLLWELSFDKDNKVKIQENKTLLKSVKECAKNADKRLSSAAEGVLWVIRQDKPEKMDAKEINKKKGSTKSQGHVMISYNWGDQAKLIKIRDVLRSHGFKIWMDIDNITGSSLQAMAEAVEKADVILMCMSEKYKNSLNCRSEAEYAFSLHKDIIPLMMQLQYTPDGWLGILRGSKIFYDFSGKYPFDAKMDELIREIGDRGKISAYHDVIVKEEIAQLGAVLPTTSNSMNVAEWIKENNLSKFTSLSSLSSDQLEFLKKISVRAPEFYYNFMLNLLTGKVKADSLTSLTIVTNAIDKIKK
ncbi:uncharacterized protein LOC131942130 [Physella acuta]|uniref:uncharacterized protein LOC131942130 n=1 Tax=Physella acuta TaxID=109671 RepID=UPI0027DE346C|nr:uncharacterized protein LOC131942130 [Physella acuta]